MIDSGTNGGRWWAWSALIVAVFAIIFLRAPEMVLAPSLPFDEGAKVFAHFYEHREPVQILRFKSGYMPLIGNMVGYAAVRLPTRAIPYGLVGSAVLITTLTYCLFFASAFRRWFPSDPTRALICLILALAPISGCLLVATSDYSLWNLLAGLILLTLCRPPIRRIWRYLHAFLCNLLVWSHPLTIIIAPLVLWRLLTDKHNRTFYRVLLFNLVIHQVYGVAGILTMQGLWRRAGGGGFELTKILDSCRWTFQIVSATAFRTAFGSPGFQWVIREQPWLQPAWMALLAVSLGLVMLKAPRTRAVIGFTGYIILSLTFLCCFLRYEDVQGDPIRFISYSSRYIYVQSLCFLIMFGTILTALWELTFHRLAGKQSRPFVRTLAALTFVPLIALTFHYLVLNAQFGHYFAKNTRRVSPYYDPDPRNGIIVRQFFSCLAEMERTRGSRAGIQLTAQKINDWPFTVDTTTPKRPKRVRWNDRARIVTVMLLLAIACVTRQRWLPLVRRQMAPTQ